MPTKLRQLRDIFELAVTENFQLKKTKQFCKIAENCQDDKLILDFYHKLNYGNKLNRIRRFRKNIIIGNFYNTPYGIIYHHIHVKVSYLTSIKNYLSDSLIDYFRIGDYLYFENLENPLVEKKPLLIGEAILIRLPVTEIKGVFVPSIRTTRLFVVNRLYQVFAEKKARGKIISKKIRDFLIKNETVLAIDLDIIPMLMLAKYNYDFVKLQNVYSEKLVKALTT